MRLVTTYTASVATAGVQRGCGGTGGDCRTTAAKKNRADRSLLFANPKKGGAYSMGANTTEIGLSEVRGNGG